MNQKEHFYTPDFYETAGIDPFLRHIEEYLKGERTVPVSRTRGHNSHDVFFTFSNPLLQKFLKNPNLIKKPYEVALKYGFRGYSVGGKNGIFFLRDHDGGLIEAVDRLTIDHEDSIREDLDFQEQGLDALRRVKIVWHNPLGKRVIGVYNTTNNRILFLGFAQY